jgi:GTPase
MIEPTVSLFPATSDRGVLRVATLGPEDDTLDEMDRLLTTLGVELAHRQTAPVRRVQAGTYYGLGKLEEFKKNADELGAVDLFVVDVELSPRQMQNIEKILGGPVLDRAGVILEIFSRHARTREAKTQVELARLQYVLPRLAHLWSHFERQRGGGVGNKGMGEKQIEVDRRLVKRRIEILRDRLKSIEKERVVQRSSRDHLLKVALVGYTNAGKSTLLNALTQSNVLSEDKLFATLDATVRSLDPDSHPPVVAIDTVGFIQRIPTSLIASFKSTLEEISEADLILHVVDASSPKAKEQMETTLEVLKDLKCDGKELITVLNKMDLLETPGERNRAKVLSPGSVRLSAHHLEEVLALRTKILEHFKSQMSTLEVLIPYEEGKLHAQIREFASVTSSKPMERGVFYRLQIEHAMSERLQLTRFLLGTSGGAQ